MTNINAQLSTDPGPGGIALSALTAVSKQGIPGNGLCETGELSTAPPLPPNSGGRLCLILGDCALCGVSIVICVFCGFVVSFVEDSGMVCFMMYITRAATVESVAMVQP